MPKGLPKAYIRKWGVSKKAWREFRKGTLTGGIRTRTRAIKRRLKGKNPKRRVRRTARRKRKSRRYSMTIPLAPFAGLFAGLAEPIQYAMGGDVQSAGIQLSLNYTGYNPADGSFDIMRLQKGVLPLVIGCLVHKFVGGAPLNLNKVLARARVPFIRI